MSNNPNADIDKVATTMNIVEAIQAAKSGRKIRRSSWGPGGWLQHVVLFPGETRQVRLFDRNFDPDGRLLLMTNANDESGCLVILDWQPVEADLHATDWETLP